MTNPYEGWGRKVLLDQERKVDIGIGSENSCLKGSSSIALRVQEEDRMVEAFSNNKDHRD